MQYKQKQIKLENIFSFWNHFKDEECFLFYNPLKDELIMGAKRLRNIDTNEIDTHYPYVFSAFTFFDTVKDNKWVDFGNEIIAFEYLFIKKENKQTLFYVDHLIDIKDRKVNKVKHHYNAKLDDYSHWTKLFEAIHHSISKGEVEKVVISREIEIHCDTSVDIESVLSNLLENNQNSFVYAYSKDGKTFLGATPEMLVQKEKDKIFSYALAGTLARNEEHIEIQKEKLLTDEKNLHEHQIVIDSIVGTIKKYTDDIEVEDTNVLVLKNLIHLFTLIYAKDENSTVFDWVKRLHPTPALGGKPKEKALELIKKYEKHERGLYAAPIGVVNGNGDGLFVVGIRGALIEDNVIYAYAGCGMVEKSDCESEYIESKNKLRTIIESL